MATPRNNRKPCPKCPTCGRKFLPPQSAIQRFMKRISVQESGCWFWTGPLNRDGYGQFGADWKVYPCHRWAYEYFIGPIPDGLVVDHKCHQPRDCAGGSECLHRRCVNPAHLETVAPIENMLRGHGPRRGQMASHAAKRAQTHCKRGHEFNEANTYIHEGRRICRLCRAEHEKRRSPRLRSLSGAGDTTSSVDLRTT
jgi:hypothetical protein